MKNMKKLIDETDFDNLNQLSRNWKKHQTKESKIDSSIHESLVFVGNKTEKQNNSNFSNKITTTKNQIQVQQEYKQTTYRRNVVPQVIDQDTEHFKNKLEHLLNNFKIDAVSEFMSMKKDMLQYQKQCVKTDTHKYLTMYEEKHQQLLQTKEKLLATSRQAERKNAQVELLSEHIAKLNERIKITQYVSRPFSLLYQNKVEEKMMKFKLREAEKFDTKRLKRKAIWGWLRLYKQNKQERAKTQSEQRIQSEVNQIVGRFQKQMDNLKQRLSQSMKKNDQYQKNAHVLQQNLKKAFLRGVCAMNMEAMGFLGGQNGQQTVQQFEDDQFSQRQVKTQKQRSMLLTNNSYMQQTKRTNPGQRQMYYQNQSMMANSKPSTNYFDSQNVQVSAIPQIKAQSKNHKWKQAPIMGMQEKLITEEPRTQVVRPTTEGKVIKVMNGKSSVDKSRSQFSSSRKNI